MRINNIFSIIFFIVAGIPCKGIVLGPLLFNLFFKDIPRFLETYIALYADDTSIYASAHHPYIQYRYIDTYIYAFLDWCSL